MSAARRILPWLALAGLGLLGWFAMVPLWTQGMAGVALDADGQPALWLAAARAAILLGGGCYAAGVAALLCVRPGRPHVYWRGLILGMGASVMAAVLFLALAGQPLRLWFLVAYGDWGTPLVRGGAAGGAFLLALLLGAGKTVPIRLIASLGAGALFMLVMQLPFGLPVADGRLVIPTMQDWLVLAFALACGLFAAWAWGKVLSKRALPENARK